MRDEIRQFLSTLSHICFFFLFLDTLSLVTPLTLLISLSFLKPLSIVFQDGILSVCFNVVVCARIQRKEKKNNWEKKKKKKRKVSKKKKIKRVLNKFWEVKWKDEILLWKKKRWKKKKMLNGNSKKSWHSDKSWKHFLYLPSPIFILFPLLLPYITF